MASSTFLGTLGPFDPDSEDWTCYCERLEQFLGVNGIDDANKKRAVLLSSCGSAVYQVIRNLVAPEKPADKPFSELVKLVRTIIVLPRLLLYSATILTRGRRKKERQYHSS